MMQDATQSASTSASRPTSAARAAGTGAPARATSARVASRLPPPPPSRAAAGASNQPTPAPASASVSARRGMAPRPMAPRPTPAGSSAANSGAATAAGASTTAASALPAPAGAAASSSSGTSAAARHAAYLASLVAAREARSREERRRKPGVKERLSSTFTLSAQTHQMAAGAGGAGGGGGAGAGRGGGSGSGSSAAASAVDRVSAGKDAEFASHPRVFSMLGGSSVDVLRSALRSAGWVENPNEWSRAWSLQWSIVGRVIDYGGLRVDQVVNHFQRAHCITSKTGLCSNVHSGARWLDADADAFFPRCYPLHVHDKEDLEEFRRDYRSNVALNLAGRFLRAYEREMGLQPWDGMDEAQVDAAAIREPRDQGEEEEELEAEGDEKHHNGDANSNGAVPPLPPCRRPHPRTPVSSFDPQLLQLCLIALQSHLRLLRHERDGLDNSLPLLPAPPQLARVDSRGVALTPYAALTPSEWNLLEEEVEKLEREDRTREEEAEARRRRRRKEAAAAAAIIDHLPVATDPVAPNSDDAVRADTAAANELQGQEGEEEREEEEEVERAAEEADAELEQLQQEQAASSPRDSSPASSSPVWQEAGTAANPDLGVGSEEASLSSLSLLSRTPLPLATLHAHFLTLHSELRTLDPQHFSLSHPTLRNLWILKPGGLSRGRGIEVHSSYRSVLALLARGGKYVAQKYIERPMLVYDKKFDVRQWVLVTNFSNVFSVWFYSAGCYLRFSSADFTLRSLDAGVHLTNNSVQKHVEGFGALPWAQGNMWGLDRFHEHVDSILPGLHATVPDARAYATGAALWAGMLAPRMRSIARLALGAAQESMELRSNSFTLLGFDFMISWDLRPWLIEVNSSPTLVGIAVPNLVEHMAHDLVQVVTGDEWSTLSESYRDKVRAERTRLDEEAKAKAEVLAALVDSKGNAGSNGAAAAPASALALASAGSKKPAGAAPSFSSSSSSSSRPGLDGKKSLSRSHSVSGLSSASAGALAAASAAATAAAAAAAAAAVGTPFILPTAHAVGYRVGGWEVVDSVFIGTVPRSHRTPAAASAATPTAPAAAAGADAKAAPRGAAPGDKKNIAGAGGAGEKKTPAQPSGLFVTGRSIPNPAAAAMASASASKLALHSNSVGRRATMPASAASAASGARSKRN